MTKEDPANADRVKHTLSTLFSLVNGVARDVDLHSSSVTATSEHLSTLAISEKGLLESVAVAVQQIIESNQKLQRQLHLADRKLDLQRQQLETYLAQARTDALTGLPNRRAFDDFLKQNLAVWARQGDPLSVVLLDLDEFKKVNDHHGHLGGDALLRSVARVMAATLRDMDLVCRIGGEEFAAILPGTQSSGAMHAAERVRNMVAASSLPYEDAEVTVTVSAGVAQAIPEDNVKTLLKRADAALYHCKRSGRNCVHLHDGKKIRTFRA